MAEDRHFYLIAYDVASPARLRKVARLLDNFGDRLQFSVFEAWLDQPLLAKLLARIEKILDAKEDRWTVQPVCGTCVERRRTGGPPLTDDTKDAAAVVV